MSFRTSCLGTTQGARRKPKHHARQGYKFSPHPQRHILCRLVEMTFSLVLLVQILWYYVELDFISGLM